LCCLACHACSKCASGTESFNSNSIATTAFSVIQLVVLVFVGNVSLNRYRSLVPSLTSPAPALPRPPAFIIQIERSLCLRIIFQWPPDPQEGLQKILLRGRPPIRCLIMQGCKIPARTYNSWLVLESFSVVKWVSNFRRKVITPEWPLGAFVELKNRENSFLNSVTKL